MNAPISSEAMRSGDEIWEHKKGKIWQLVARLTQENRALRYQIRVLNARLRSHS